MVSVDSRAAKTEAHMATPQPKLLDQVRGLLRSRHYSLRTEESYVNWIRRFVQFHGLRHPRDMGRAEVERFLTHLAVDEQVAASTQNQARCAILFLYREVLVVPIEEPADVVAARMPDRLPTVLTKAEVRAVLAQMSGVYLLMAQLLYGGGLRLMECVRLRVKDLDFAQGQLSVRDGKGMHDRVTTLPARLAAPLREQLRAARALHQADLTAGYGAVHLPYALARKLPGAPREWAWQYVFPAERISADPRTGELRRHHLDERGLQKAVRAAVIAAGIAKPAERRPIYEAITVLSLWRSRSKDGLLARGLCHSTSTQAARGRMAKTNDLTERCGTNA
jgi:integron integrase